MLEGFEDISALLGPGVYALYWREELMYVGKAKRLLPRVYAHRNLLERSLSGRRMALTGPHSREKVIRFDRVFIRPCSVDSLDAIEQELIRTLRPRRNIQYNVRDAWISQITVAGVKVAIGAILPKQNYVAQIERRF